MRAWLRKSGIECVSKSLQDNIQSLIRLREKLYAFVVALQVLWMSLVPAAASPST